MLGNRGSEPLEHVVQLLQHVIHLVGGHHEAVHLPVVQDAAVQLPPKPRVEHSAKILGPLLSGFQKLAGVGVILPVLNCDGSVAFKLGSSVFFYLKNVSSGVGTRRIHEL